jgi:hypothetical protein
LGQRVLTTSSAMSYPRNSLTNVQEVLHALEEGTKLVRYYRGRRDVRLFQVRLETRELVWSRSSTGRPEGTGKSLFILSFDDFGALICRGLAELHRRPK